MAGPAAAAVVGTLAGRAALEVLAVSMAAVAAAVAVERPVERAEPGEVES
jgi:hypothetical protein